MRASGAVKHGQSFPRPSLFGVAELDNVVAEGGLAPGAVHVLEAASSASMAEAALHAQAVAAFAAGFGARFGASACWLGPPPDLLSPGVLSPSVTLATDEPDLWQRIETNWDARRTPDLSMMAGDAPRLLVLDARQAYRLATPVSLARKLAKQGRVVVFLAHDASEVMARLALGPVTKNRLADQGAPGAKKSGASNPEGCPSPARLKNQSGIHVTCWRIGQVPDGAGGEAASPGLWRVELMRSDSVRRIVVSACDASGRMSAAPRDIQGGGQGRGQWSGQGSGQWHGKEMARRFASVISGLS